MDRQLDVPSTVLVLTRQDSFLGRLADALGESGLDTADVATVSAALHRVGDDDVACLVVATTDEDVPDLVASAAEQAPAVPVIYTPPERDAARTARVAAEGGRFVPRTDDDTDLLAAIEDAVERYRRQRVWSEDSDILETILSDLGVPIYAKDAEGRHVRASDVEGGPGPDELLGKTDAEVWAEDSDFDESATIEDDMHVVETGQPIREKEERHGDPPAVHWSRTTKVPWRDEDGSIRGLVGISEDITELKTTARELERQNERLEQFARYVSHDLKNPLQVAMGYVDLARKGGGLQVEKIDGALTRMDEMLEDLQRTARAGGVPESAAEPSATASFSELVEEVWETVASEAATLDVQFDGPVTVGTPEPEIRPLVENLLKNAVEHGSTSPDSRARQDAVDHGGDDVTVRVGPLSTGFYVEDDGPGIPEDERDRVTEAGFTTAESGTGTGLSLVSEVAGDRRWDFEVTESQAGGARFEFRNVMLAPDRPTPPETGQSHELDDAADVGEVRVGERGSYDADEDRWTVEAGGTDIWRDENGFHYVFARVAGDVRIQARIADFDPAADFSKAGLMARSDTTEESAYGYVGTTGEHGTETLWRDSDGALGRSQQLEERGLDVAYYRLDRVGDRLTCAISEDGSSWLTVDERPVDLDDPVCVGLAVCSVLPRVSATAVFDDVTVTELGQSNES